jgi:hypothetical protein
MMTDQIKHEDWRVADRAADLLSIDREVCRRAFYQEPEERVREIVQWVLAEQGVARDDLEWGIERWAREHGAGVYGQNRRCGDLERLEGIMGRIVFECDPAA